jgi:hypothetical protein
MGLNKKMLLAVSIICSFIFISADTKYSGAAPTGNTGAEGSTCRNCHGGNPLNASGGSVTIDGLPSTYTPGQTYNFTVKINHGNSDRKRWGFAVKAVTSTNPTVVGTFSENNPNALISDGEIGHSNAPTTTSSNTYTFNNLSWTAPANPSPNSDATNIIFYVIGNAADGVTGMPGDFIYTTTQTVTLNTPSSVNESVLSHQNVNIATAGKSILVDFSLSKPSSIQPIIYSLGGQKLLNLPEKKYNSGKHNINIDGSNLSGGTYLLIIQNNGKALSKKFVL